MAEALCCRKRRALVKHYGAEDMDTEIVLETRSVGKIKGEFFVPSYQRGYCWGKSEVRQLLDDIYRVAVKGKSSMVTRVMLAASCGAPESRSVRTH